MAWQTFETYTSADLNYSVLPVPKYDEDMGYVTILANPSTFYGIPYYAGVDGTAGMCSAFLEALASESYRTLTPVIFELCFKTKYADDPETAKSFDIIRESISFDIGRLFPNDLVKQTLFRNAVKDNAAAKWNVNASIQLELLADKLEILQAALTANGQ